MSIVDQKTNTYEPKTSTTAILSLVSGILAWLGIFGLGGILAVIFGYVAKKDIKNSHGYITGDGLATAGLVLGYTNIAISIIGLCLGLMIFFGLLSTPVLCLPFLNDINSTISFIP